MLSRLIAVRTSEVCSSEYSSACITAGTPAADFLGGLTFGFSTPIFQLPFVLTRNGRMLLSPLIIAPSRTAVQDASVTDRYGDYHPTDLPKAWLLAALLAY